MASTRCTSVILASDRDGQQREPPASRDPVGIVLATAATTFGIEDAAPSRSTCNVGYRKARSAQTEHAPQPRWTQASSKEYTSRSHGMR
ncbi:hypothetical protein [Sporisorium scitamineum]|uniref:Uncharacterized protein n=1 Tax=Sporisorium scitamineum TaxID=49012 RepID=A0A0F7S0U0_9BASI|nr:hypothetical protein [Sporisorium scitamineum]